MENDERLAAHRCELAVQIIPKCIKACKELFQIVLIGACMVRINFTQFSGNRLCDRCAIGRIKPEMGINTVFIMMVTFLDRKSVV